MNTFSPINCTSLLEARAAAWRGERLTFPQAEIASVNCSGLLPFILEKATENIRRWAIRLVALPDVDECIRLAGVLMNHPGEEAVDAIRGMDSATYFSVVQFLPTCDSRN